jgi:soluble lytic murein transglycosylase-like protein
MKRAVAVISKFISSNSNVACLLSAATSVYLTAFCFFCYQHHQRLVQQAAAAQHSERRAPTVELTRSAEILFVSEIIKAALPSHPDRDALAAIIVTESRRANIDPLFVTAVIKAESMFKQKAVSHRGAQGLMQLMPTTGKYISTLSNIEIPGKLDLHDPAINVRLGIAYLKYLDQKFHGNQQRILIAYNWGPTNLSKALRSKGTPPTQSVQYAHKILSHHTMWRSSLPPAPEASEATALG